MIQENAAILDPTTLSTIWTNCISICEEIGIQIRKTAYSQTVREADDFSVGMFNGKGILIAQGVFSPTHLGSMPFMLKHVLEEYPPETWDEGDTIVANQPWIGAGHLNDIYTTVPVFYENELVGFISAIVHHIDVGGVKPGSQAVEGVSDLWADGFQIAPVKLYKRGEPVEEVFKFISANVRDPDKTIGDLKAQRNAIAHHGRMRILDLYKHFGKETMFIAGQEMIRRTEEAVRGEIAEIPEGIYEGESYLDDYGPDTPPIKMKATITVKDRGITVDYTGTDPQVKAGCNGYLNFSRAWTLFALRVLFGQNTPQNWGGIVPITVKAPEGCFLNAKKGAPSGGRAMIIWPLVELIMDAFHKVRPEKAIAPYGAMSHGSLGGIDPRNGRRFVGSDFGLGFHGARYNKDALMLFGPPVCKNIPVEVWEHGYPLRIERKELLPDSAGAGKYRGGPALRTDVRFLVDDWTYSNLTVKHRIVPSGFEGAKPAMRTSTVINREDGTSFEMEGNGNYEHLKYNDLQVMITAGSGGWGNPLDRDPEMVLKDVIIGYVTVESARKDYGVVIVMENGNYLIDKEETDKLRESMKSKEEK